MTLLYEVKDMQNQRPKDTANLRPYIFAHFPCPHMIRWPHNIPYLTHDMSPLSFLPTYSPGLTTPFLLGSPSSGSSSPPGVSLNCWRTASMMGSIIAVVAVLLMNIDKMKVGSMNPSINLEYDGNKHSEQIGNTTTLTWVYMRKNAKINNNIISYT